MARLGISPHVIEAMLNHVSVTSPGLPELTIARTMRPKKKAALARWADSEGRQIDLLPPPEVKFDDGDVMPILLTRGRYENTVTSGIWVETSSTGDPSRRGAPRYPG
jgi:hypothetical protein